MFASIALINKFATDYQVTDGPAFICTTGLSVKMHYQFDCTFKIIFIRYRLSGNERRYTTLIGLKTLYYFLSYRTILKYYVNQVHVS